MSALSVPSDVPLPLSPTQAGLLAQLVDGMGAGALHWLSGYAYGLAAQPARAPRWLHAVDAQAAQPRATIVYGSQTGNARREAERLHRELEAAGLPARLLRADAYPQRELADERMLYLVFSTQGDGEPSDDARGFVEYLAGRRAPRLPGLHYAVLGLGDSSYPQFCVIGRQLDARLAELGAQRLQAVATADVDVGTIAAPWQAQALRDARERLADATPATTNVTPLRTPASVAAATREAPLAAEVLANQRITARDSGKDVRHLELSLAGSGLRYEPGDALGVWPRNPPALVDEVLATLSLDRDAPVDHDGTRLPLAQWLGERRELTRLARPFLVAQAERAGDVALTRLLDDPQQLAPWVAVGLVLVVLGVVGGVWVGVGV
ncbi:MAG: assimilatory sulfite reductase (NADPH) flavoprotein subunit, partial [Lysobacter sp.]|nr:assimilatory sulfite reductase (NADPH) flavoprotein subunit [Lysobacter sp.]